MLFDNYMDSLHRGIVLFHLLVKKITHMIRLYIYAIFGKTITYIQLLAQSGNCINAPLVNQHTRGEYFSTLSVLLFIEVNAMCVQKHT